MTTTLTLPARPPFSLSPVIKSHGWVQLAPFTHQDDYTKLAYIDRLASGLVVEYQVQETSVGVQVTLENELSPAEEGEVKAKVAWMLGLEQDFSEFYGLANQEPKLAQAVAGAKGRVLRSPTLFEDVIKTILTTNTAWGGTIRMAANLVTQYGSPLPADPEQHAFPTPEQLAANDVEALRSQARLGYRSPYVLELSRRVASGELDLEALKTSDLPTPELRKRLLALKGVGDYAAANLLMLLGRYDYLPVDSWALKVVSHEWYEGQPIGRSEVEAAFERWGQWKGLVYWFWDWAILSDNHQVTISV